MNLRIAFVLILYILSVHAENPDSARSKILSHKSEILNASNKFDISPNILASIIYVERSNNFTWADIALDALIAKRGYNSSLGFCQIKIKTAYWIEVQINDSLSAFYPGKKYYGLFEISESPDELLRKILDDSLNINYAAAYIKLIKRYWGKNGYRIDKKPEIIGTLYSIGLFRAAGNPRAPHAHPKPNWFGQKVKASFFKFINLFVDSAHNIK